MTVSMAWRLRDDEKLRRLRGAVEDAMRRARLDMQPLAGDEKMVRAVDFNSECAVEDVEELLRASVGVPRLGGAGGHAFLNDTEVVGCEEVPTVAASPPLILGSGGNARR